MNKWTTHSDQFQTAMRRIKEIAEEKGLHLNPDEERVMKVVGLMTNNFVESGQYFCPCKQSHPLKPAEDVTCPCPSCEDEIAKDGHCRCKLFFKAQAVCC